MTEYRQIFLGEQTDGPTNAVSLPTPDEVNGLMEAVGWPPCPAEDWEYNLGTSMAVAFARSPESTPLIGLARIIGDRRYASVHDVAVHPDFCRQGIGTAMMEAIMPIIPPSVVSVQLLAAGKEFHRGLGFGQRHGFRQTVRGMILDRLAGADPQDYRIVGPDHQ